MQSQNWNQGEKKPEVGQAQPQLDEILSRASGEIVYERPTTPGEPNWWVNKPTQDGGSIKGLIRRVHDANAHNNYRYVTAEPSRIVHYQRGIGGYQTLSPITMPSARNTDPAVHSENKNKFLRSVRVDGVNSQPPNRSGDPYLPDDDEAVFVQKVSPTHDELDVEFLPVARSLKGNGLVRPEWMEVRWQDISSTLPGAPVFSSQPSPDDIVQGELADAYFLAGISALSEKPHLIQDIVAPNQNPK